MQLPPDIDACPPGHTGPKSRVRGAPEPWAPHVGGLGSPTSSTRWRISLAETVATSERLVYLNHPDVIDEQLAVTTGGATYWPLTDALGSVYALTDSGGNVTRSYGYDAYGARSTSGTGLELAYGFTGREHDGSGMRYHRDRYADPVLGRWSQPDRLGMVDGPNVYAYVSGQPTVSVDPHGMSAISIGVARSIANVTVEVISEAGGRYLEQAARQDDPWLADALADYGFTLIQMGVAIGVAMAVQSKTCAATGTRRPWAITRANTSKVVAHSKFGKFYQHDSTKLWWTKDQAGHGGSVWKVYEKQGNRLVHRADADEFGDFIPTKHKGLVGESIPWKDLSGADF